MKKFSVRFIVRAAVIAALYVALTLAFAPISYGDIQLRVSEALTILPILSLASVPGLFVGCLIANLFGQVGFYDILFGSLATLAASVATRLLRKNRFLAASAPVIINAVVIGAMLSVLYNLPLAITMLTVGAGEAIACYLLGLPLLAVLKKLPSHILENDM